MANFLITGGSRGYGGALVYYLRSKGHVVYTAQRTVAPAAGDEGREVSTEFMLECDFSNPDECVKVVEFFVLNEILLSGVVHAVGMREERSLTRLNVFDVERHISTNVLSPFFFSTYLQNTKCFESGASIVWLCDSHKRRPEHLGYMISKRVQNNIVPMLHSIYLKDRRLLMVYCPRSDIPGSDDIVCRRLELILTGEEAPKNSVVDLR